jgi:histidine ammonia-lyase
VFALAVEAFNTPLGHFDEEIDGYWNNPHDTWALTRLRELIDGGHGGERRPYQAPVSFRIVPRILGQAHLAAQTVREVAGQSLPAMSDNPALLPADARNPNGRAVSTGGYHNAQAPLVLDMLTASYVNLCVLAGRLSAKMMDGAISLLPPQLGVAEGRAYVGCLPMAITGYEEEARMLASATLLPGSESGGFGQNDVASPVFLAWSKQDRAGLLLEQSLAALAPVAMLALDITDRPVPAPLAALAEATRTHVPVDLQGLMLGPATAELAQWLRGRVYGG